VIVPILLGRTREHRDAIRFADGANLEHERASGCAWVVLPVVLLAAVVAILVTG
jgi:phage baseplate assembly protein gpV